MDIQHRITRARLEDQLENAYYAIRGFKMQQQHEGCSDEFYQILEDKISSEKSKIIDLKGRMAY